MFLLSLHNSVTKHCRIDSPLAAMIPIGGLSLAKRIDCSHTAPLKGLTPNRHDDRYQRIDAHQAGMIRDKISTCF